MQCVITNLAGRGFQKACVVANAATFMFDVSAHTMHHAAL